MANPKHPLFALEGSRLLVRENLFLKERVGKYATSLSVQTRAPAIPVLHNLRSVSDILAGNVPFTT